MNIPGWKRTKHKINKPQTFNSPLRVFERTLNKDIELAKKASKRPTAQDVGRNKHPDRYQGNYQVCHCQVRDVAVGRTTHAPWPCHNRYYQEVAHERHQLYAYACANFDAGLPLSHGYRCFGVRDGAQVFVFGWLTHRTTSKNLLSTKKSRVTLGQGLKCIADQWIIIKITSLLSNMSCTWRPFLFTYQKALLMLIIQNLISLKLTKEKENYFNFLKTIFSQNVDNCFASLF